MLWNSHPLIFLNVIFVPLQVSWREKGETLWLHCLPLSIGNVYGWNQNLCRWFGSFLCWLCRFRGRKTVVMLVNGSFESTPSQVIKQSFGFGGKLMPSSGTRLPQWWHKDCGGQPLPPPTFFGSFLNTVTIVLNPSPDGFLWTKWWNYETTSGWTIWCMAVPPR